MRLIIFLFTTIIWAVIGFFFWISILFRVMAVFTGLVIITMFQDPKYRAKAKIPSSAITFYPDGFKFIKESVFNNDNFHQTSNAKRKTDWDKVVQDVVWAIIFWGSIFFTIFIFVNKR